jgi:hypothetical protein
MAITISGGKKVSSAKDAVTVTVGGQADVGDGTKFPNSIAIQFTGKECHTIQIFMRTKMVCGKADTEVIGTDSGGFNTFKFSADQSPDWLVDTTSASSPYYDFGYAGEQVGSKYIMVDAPTMTGGKFDLSCPTDSTRFDAYTFCLSDKDIIAIVHWFVVKQVGKAVAPDAEIIHDIAWWDRLYLGRRTLSKQSFSADLYLPTACMA